MRRLPAPVLVFGAIVSVQCGGAVAAKLFDRAGPGGTVLLRLALAAVVLLPIVRPRIRGRSGRDLRAAAVFGLVLAGMNACFYQALERTPLGLAVTLEFVGPLAVAIGASRRRLDLLWAGLAAGGVALLAGRGGGDVTTLGVVFALAAGAFWAAYILVSQRIGRVFPGASGLAIALLVGAVAVAPYGVIDGGDALVEPGVLAAGLAVALLSSAVPYSLELTALRRLSAAVFGVLMSLEPAVASLVGLIVLSQRLTVVQVVAVAMVCLASLGATAPVRRPLDQPVSG
ncbi:MAG: inner rane transporter RhtA [Frankiales bacterium]|nr:inner rane transporter RhtA [Frankiales bacterium]